MTFVYDAVGNRKLLHDASGRYSLTYDKVNRVLSSTSPQGRLTYTYDPVGDRRTLAVSDAGTFTYVHDSAQRLVGLTNPLEELTTLGYDAAGQNTSRQLANGTAVTRQYDAAGNFSRTVDVDSLGTTICAYGYDFDAIGNRTAVNDADSGEEYSNWDYDCIAQLGSEMYFIGWGWARLTLTQWSLMTADDWDLLPVDVLGVYTYQFQYSSTGNRLVQADPESGGRVTLPS